MKNKENKSVKSSRRGKLPIRETPALLRIDSDALLTGAASNDTFTEGKSPDSMSETPAISSKDSVSDKLTEKVRTDSTPKKPSSGNVNSKKKKEPFSQEKIYMNLQVNPDPHLEFETLHLQLSTKSRRATGKKITKAETFEIIMELTDFSNKQVIAELVELAIKKINGRG